eukprot:NODE_710_length_1845_cov_16.554566_g579_i0.p1 GENE.NODE_710_length_1845_cov_16.554566_g579_i0~~NODE_710_length_1845_cov_16.554566_g579_i0.p1  ORF type:complete len:600 (+),score=162.84 NODE_710_length_1845_cov_16.554566_g579_i0:26-1801(+)
MERQRNEITEVLSTLTRTERDWDRVDETNVSSCVGEAIGEMVEVLGNWFKGLAFISPLPLAENSAIGECADASAAGGGAGFSASKVVKLGDGPQEDGKIDKFQNESEKVKTRFIFNTVSSSCMPMLRRMLASTKSIQARIIRTKRLQVIEPTAIGMNQDIQSLVMIPVVLNRHTVALVGLINSECSAQDALILYDVLPRIWSSVVVDAAPIAKQRREQQGSKELLLLQYVKSFSAKQVEMYNSCRELWHKFESRGDTTGVTFLSPDADAAADGAVFNAHGYSLYQYYLHKKDDMSVRLDTKPRTPFDVCITRMLNVLTDLMAGNVILHALNCNFNKGIPGADADLFKLHTRSDGVPIVGSAKARTKGLRNFGSWLADKSKALLLSAKGKVTVSVPDVWRSSLFVEAIEQRRPICLKGENLTLPTGHFPVTKVTVIPIVAPGEECAALCVLANGNCGEFEGLLLQSWLSDTWMLTTQEQKERSLATALTDAKATRAQLQSMEEKYDFISEDRDALKRQNEAFAAEMEQVRRDAEMFRLQQDEFNRMKKALSDVDYYRVQQEFWKKKFQEAENQRSKLLDKYQSEKQRGKGRD